jgi:hypothetical protein
MIPPIQSEGKPLGIAANRQNDALPANKNPSTGVGARVHETARVHPASGHRVLVIGNFEEKMTSR